jgi:hypothetical protein
MACAKTIMSYAFDRHYRLSGARPTSRAFPITEIRRRPGRSPVEPGTDAMMTRASEARRPPLDAGPFTATLNRNKVLQANSSAARWAISVVNATSWSQLSPTRPAYGPPIDSWQHAASSAAYCQAPRRTMR